MKSENLDKAKRLCIEMEHLMDLARVFRDKKFGQVFFGAATMRRLGKKVEEAILSEVSEVQNELKRLS